MPPTPTSSDLARAVREFRESRRMSGRAFCDLTGIGTGHLSELESGKKNLTAALIERIAAGFSMPVEKVSEELEEIYQADKYRSVVREMPAPYNISPPPLDDMHQLAAWLVGRMEKTEIRGILDGFTEAAMSGDVGASARARALLLLLQNP
ncbi:MAG: helix-turn-helix transcriptional regulator [Luteolibacter sp.]